MIRIGAASLRANGISIMLFGFYTVYSSLFLALGKGREGFYPRSLQAGDLFYPVILLLPIVWGLNGIMYAQPIADDAFRSHNGIHGDTAPQKAE